MTVSRRRLMQGLGAGVLGAGVLSACTGTSGGRRGRRRPTTTAPSAEDRSEPTEPLVLASLGAATGRTAAWEQIVAIAVSEAMIDLNARYGGLYGQDVRMLERHVLEDPEEDLSGLIEEYVEQGVAAVITSVDEDALVRLAPAFAAAGIAMIDVITSGMQVRADEVDSAGMLVRLCPNTVALATAHVEESFAGSSDRGGAPGTVALLSEDTAQGRSLAHEMEQQLNPRAGSLREPHYYPFGELGDTKDLVASLREDPPALLVVNGGPEVTPFLKALHEATLDEDGRPEVEIPIRLAPAAVADYVDADLPAESLTRTRGSQPGTELPREHVLMMLNVEPDLQHTVLGYSQQAYDAVMMAALASYHALAVDGPAIAAALPQILTGADGCSDLDGCRTVMRDALQAGTRTTITFTGRTGPLTLGAEGDARTGEVRTYDWSDANEIQAGTAEGFELEA